MKGPKGAGVSKSSKKGSKKSRKAMIKDDSEDEDVAKDNDSEDDGSVQSASGHDVEKEEEIRSSNLNANENDAEGTEESNLDERTPKRSSITAVVSASHSKKRSHSLSSEPRKVPPSKRLQITSLMSKKSHKPFRESSHSIRNIKTSSTSITPQVLPFVLNLFLQCPYALLYSSLCWIQQMYFAAESSAHRLDHFCC